MGIIFLEVGRKAADFFLQNWKVMGWPVAFLFFWLWMHPKACPPCLVVPVAAHQEAAAKASTRVEIRYVTLPGGGPSPCPDVTVESATASSVTQTVEQKAPECPAVPFWGIELAGSVPVYKASDSAAGLSLLAGPWRIGGAYANESGPRVELAHHWMFK